MTDAAVRFAGGHVVTPERTVEALDVVVSGDRIVAVEPPGGVRPSLVVDVVDVIDVTGELVAPGYIDLQLNGGWGCDFTVEPESIATVAARLPASGVTAFVPTIVTGPSHVRWAALDAIASLVAPVGSAVPLGLHFEGPAISPRRVGAHDSRWIGHPDDDEVTAWSRDRGVAVVTVAPEIEGATALIEALTAAGIVVSAGHSECTVDEFSQACAAGVSMVTHLFNAMGPFTHRDPGLIGATLAGDVFAGLICDGIHVDPVAVRIAWRAVGRDRTILVTDAMSALGVDMAATRLGGISVSVDETGVRTPDGTLAGSNLALDRAVRNLVEFTGCPPADAIGAVTANPAAVLGLRDRGRVAVGARADLVVLDADLGVRLTMIGGEVAWRS